MRLACSLLILLPSVAFAQEPSLKGNVLVWQDAPLFTEPSETAHSLTLATFDGAARKDRVGHVLPMTVVSSKGDFVEVELIGDDDCAYSHLVVPDDIARVRLFVRRTDIAPVLVKPFAKTFSDGTSISLGVGTPVVATDAGTFRVSLRGDVLEVDPPAASVGEAYTPAKASNTMMPGETLTITRATKASLGGRTIALTSWKGSPVEKRGTNALVALDDRCVSARVVVAANSLLEVDESSIDFGGSSGTASSALRDEFYVPRLTPLSVGTKQVAVAAKPIYLHAEPMGKSACITRQIRIDSVLEIKPTEERLRICAPATKVARDSMRTIRSAQGSTSR
jgi:hypothetical protein